MHRSRTAAFFLVLLSAVLLSSSFAYAQEEDDGDGNLECPSVPSLYVYVSGVAYGQSIGDKVNLYGKKCVSTENGAVAAKGHCVGPKNCKADLCDNKPCELTKLPPPSLSDTGDVSGGQTQEPQQKIPTQDSSPMDWMLNPVSEKEKELLSPSAQSFEDLIKQSGAMPSEGEKKPSTWLDSVKDFFSPPAVSPDESFQLQPRDENGDPIPQDVGPQNTITNPNSTFDAPSDESVQTSDGIPQG